MHGGSTTCKAMSGSGAEIGMAWHGRMRKILSALPMDHSAYSAEVVGMHLLWDVALSIAMPAIQGWRIALSASESAAQPNCDN